MLGLGFALLCLSLHAGAKDQNSVENTVANDKIANDTVAKDENNVQNTITKDENSEGRMQTMIVDSVTPLYHMLLSLS